MNDTIADGGNSGIRWLIGLATAALLLATVSAFADQVSVPAEYVVHDERLHRFMSRDAALETLASGFEWAEGPLWVAELGALLFSDIGADTVYRWDAANGVTTFVSPSGHSDGEATPWRGSNGLALDEAGRLLLAQHGGRRVARLNAPLGEPQPLYETVADRFDGKRLNSPNDLLVDRFGTMYFTDPPYGLDGAENSAAIEQDFFAVFRRTPDGQITAIATELEKPNGIALSVDQSRLYASNSETGKEKIIVVPLDESGGPGKPQDFFEQRSQFAAGPGSTDGMAMHPSGYLFISTPNGVGILSPDAELLGELLIGQVTNVAFDTAADYLYITAPQRLLRIRIAARE